MAPSWQWIAVVLLNTMNGPGYVTLPQAGRDAGPGVVVAVIGGFGLLAAFTSRRAIAVVAELEARRGAGGVGDFASMSRDVLGARAAAAAAAACVAALLACGLAQIILCVQLADALELRATGVRCAVALRAPPAAAGPRVDVGCRRADEPRPGPAVELSRGVALTLALCAYAARLAKDASAVKAKDDRAVEKRRRLAAAPQCVGAACFLGAALLFPRFVARRGAARALGDVAAVGPAPAAALAPVCFNFAFVLAVPALAANGGAARARRGSDAAVAAATLAYAALAALGAGAGAAEPHVALAMARGGDAGDALGVFLLYVSQLAAIDTYLAAAARALDVFGPRKWALEGPVWLLAIGSKDSGAFGLVVDWTSVLLLGLTNFSLPLALDEALGYPKLKRSSSSDLLLLGAAAAPRSRSRAASRVAFVAATAAFVALIAARCGAPEVVAAAAALAVAGRLLARPRGFAPDTPTSAADARQFDGASPRARLDG